MHGPSSSGAVRSSRASPMTANVVDEWSLTAATYP
jgi:hypothetical protein